MPHVNIIFNKKGCGGSEGAEFRRSYQKSGTSSVPSSGGGTFHRPATTSDRGKLTQQQIKVRCGYIIKT